MGYLSVSILVLMEELLRQINIDALIVWCKGFNPCFNGRASKTAWDQTLLVNVMKVSILVLMEELLRPLPSEISLSLQKCFNPCFNGRASKTK